MNAPLRQSELFERPRPQKAAGPARSVGIAVKRALVVILRNGLVVEAEDEETARAEQEKLAKKLERQVSMGVHYSEAKDQWSTPQDFFNELDREFSFEIDVCALPENAKCARYFTPEQDGLAQEWRGACWMNPPYGRAIPPWVKKAYESAQAGATVVCLVPARTDTKWWHTYVTKASEIRYVKGRLKFGGSKDNAPFPCAVVIFRPPARTADLE